MKETYFIDILSSSTKNEERIRIENELMEVAKDISSINGLLNIIAFSKSKTIRLFAAIFLKRFLELHKDLNFENHIVTDNLISCINENLYDPLLIRQFLSSLYGNIIVEIDGFIQFVFNLLKSNENFENNVYYESLIYILIYHINYYSETVLMTFYDELMVIIIKCLESMKSDFIVVGAHLIEALYDCFPLHAICKLSGAFYRLLQIFSDWDHPTNNYKIFDTSLSRGDSAYQSYTKYNSQYYQRYFLNSDFENLSNLQENESEIKAGNYIENFLLPRKTKTRDISATSDTALLLSDIVINILEKQLLNDSIGQILECILKYSPSYCLFSIINVILNMYSHIIDERYVTDIFNMVYNFMKVNAKAIDDIYACCSTLEYIAATHPILCTKLLDQTVMVEDDFGRPGVVLSALLEHIHKYIVFKKQDVYKVFVNTIRCDDIEIKKVGIKSLHDLSLCLNGDDEIAIYCFQRLTDFLTFPSSDVVDYSLHFIHKILYHIVIPRDMIIGFMERIFHFVQPLKRAKYVFCSLISNSNSNIPYLDRVMPILIKAFSTKESNDPDNISFKCKAIEALSFLTRYSKDIDIESIIENSYNSNIYEQQVSALSAITNVIKGDRDKCHRFEYIFYNAIELFLNRDAYFQSTSLLFFDQMVKNDRRLDCKNLELVLKCCLDNCDVWIQIHSMKILSTIYLRLGFVPEDFCTKIKQNLDSHDVIIVSSSYNAMKVLMDLLDVSVIKIFVNQINLTDYSVFFSLHEHFQKQFIKLANMILNKYSSDIDVDNIVNSISYVSLGKPKIQEYFVDFVCSLYKVTDNNKLLHYLTELIQISFPERVEHIFYSISRIGKDIIPDSIIYQSLASTNELINAASAYLCSLVQNGVDITRYFKLIVQNLEGIKYEANLIFQVVCRILLANQELCFENPGFNIVHLSRILSKCQEDYESLELNIVTEDLIRGTIQKLRDYSPEADKAFIEEIKIPGKYGMILKRMDIKHD